MGRSAGGKTGAVVGAVIGSPGGAPGIVAGAFVGDFAGTAAQQAVEDRPVRVGEDVKRASIAGATAAVFTGVTSLFSPTPEVVVIQPNDVAVTDGAFVNAPVPAEATEAGTVAGPSGGEQTILVSRAGQAAPGTSLSHVALDTSLYVPGDVAGPLVDFGPGTNLYATLPEGQAALDAARGNAYPGFLEGPGTYLTSSIPEFGLPATPNDVYGSNIPTEKKPGWWTQAAGAAAGHGFVSGLTGLFQRGFQALEQALGILPKPSETTRIGRSDLPLKGEGGGGGGAGRELTAQDMWLWAVLYLFAILAVLFIVRAKRP